jgi:hypothetical protein
VFDTDLGLVCPAWACTVKLFTTVIYWFSK